MDNSLAGLMDIIKAPIEAFKPGGVYIPGFFKTVWNNIFNPSAKPSEEPKISKTELPPVSTYYPSELPEQLQQTAPDRIVPQTTLDNVTTYFPTKNLPEQPNVLKDVLSSAWKFLDWGTENFLKFYQTKQVSDYYSKMAEAELQSQKAAQSIAEAQQRIAELQMQTEQYKKGVSNILSQEALKKYSPYLVPIIVGLAVIMILLIMEKRK